MNKREMYDCLYSLFQEISEDIETLEWCPFFEKDALSQHKLFASDDIDFIGNGCSKWVFSLKKFPDVVFKVSFRGISFSDGRESFQCAKDYDQGWDYCAIEEIIYRKALSAGVGNFFPETRYLGEVGSLRIYTAEKMQPYVSPESFGKKAKEVADKCSSYYKEFPIEIAQGLADSGYKLWEIVELASFLAEEEIYDLYSENFGLDKEGKFRIIDFSSFND